jgi:hypothetical protein
LLVYTYCLAYTFSLETGAIFILRNVRWLSSDYMILYPRKIGVFMKVLFSTVTTNHTNT